MTINPTRMSCSFTVATLLSFALAAGCASTEAEAVGTRNDRLEKCIAAAEGPEAGAEGSETPTVCAAAGSCADQIAAGEAWDREDGALRRLSREIESCFNGAQPSDFACNPSIYPPSLANSENCRRQRQEFARCEGLADDYNRRVNAQKPRPFIEPRCLQPVVQPQPQPQPLPVCSPETIKTVGTVVIVAGVAYICYQVVKDCIAVGGAPVTGGASLCLIAVP